MIRNELGGFRCRPTLRESALETESQNWSGLFVRYPHSLLHLRKPKRMEGVKIQLKMFFCGVAWHKIVSRAQFQLILKFTLEKLPVFLPVVHIGNNEGIALEE
jgi:hypothetical protein